MRPAIPRVAPCLLAYTTRTDILIISASTIGHVEESRQGPNVLCQQARSSLRAPRISSATVSSTVAVPASLDSYALPPCTRNALF